MTHQRLCLTPGVVLLRVVRGRSWAQRRHYLRLGLRCKRPPGRHLCNALGAAFRIARANTEHTYLEPTTRRSLCSLYTIQCLSEAWLEGGIGKNVTQQQGVAIDSGHAGMGQRKAWKAKQTIDTQRQKAASGRRQGGTRASVQRAWQS